MTTQVMHKIIENYILYESIGAGQYGKVFRAKNTVTGEIVAVKTIPLQKFAQVPKLEEFTTNEIKILARINNENVVRFIEMLRTVNNMYLVYECCEGGTLEDIIQRRRFLPEVEALTIFLQLRNAFKAIYKENILHRDLKPSNILIHNGVYKIADFGFCKKVSGPQELTFTMVGSPIYMAPEILKGYPYNIKGDLWSLGVVLYEMLFGICPFEDKTLAGLIRQIDRKPLTFPRHINNISKGTEDLLRRMLVLDHRKRIDWKELLEYKINVPGEEKIQRTPAIDTKTHENKSSNTNAGSAGNATNTEAAEKPANSDNTENTKKTGSSENAVNTGAEAIGNKDSTGSTESARGTGSAGDRGSAGCAEVRVDVDAVNKYNERLQQKATAEERIMRTLMKERNKVVFLTNMVKTALELNIGSKVAAVIYLLLKKAYILIEVLRKDISIENSFSKFRTFEVWEEFQLTEEYMTFSGYINEEIEEIVVYTAIVKREIETLVTGNDYTSGDILRDPIFETELLSNGNLNDRFFRNTLLAYAEEVKEKAHEKALNREESGLVETMRHANEILDCVNMEEFFEKTLIDSGLRLEEQRYFAYVRTCDKDKLQNMVNDKLNEAKVKTV